METQLPDGSWIPGYANDCPKCDTIMSTNLYGMGTCHVCGYRLHRIDPKHEAELNKDWKPPVATRDPQPCSDCGTFGCYHSGGGCIPGFDINAFHKAVADGVHDAELDRLTEVIGQRKEVRRKALLAQVQELYGPNATITVPRG